MKPSRVYSGMPGHFIGAVNCCFHLTTRVNGKWLVSSVGCYHPGGIKTNQPEEIGLDRLFETMVFRVAADGGVSDWTEVDSAGYHDADNADVGHEMMVRKYEAQP